jgi:membrane-associated protease RseP (regulator of RpoE activity)
MSAEPEPERGSPGEEPEPQGRPRYGLSALLFVLTCWSTTYVGADGGPLAAGLAYSVPLMAILLSHEFGHYIAARIHRVPASLPYFVPLPIPPLGTMGAVILMRERIASRNALLDIGAAGPLAGLAVALPVLVYGIMESPVQAMPDGMHYDQEGQLYQEGHSLLYAALLRVLKGPIPDGYDIMLTPTAFAGWAGLLVTMLNLLPSLQLDGGHVAYALLGERYQRVSSVLRRSLLPLAIGVSVFYGLTAFAAGKRGDALLGELEGGMQWFLWWLLLSLMARGPGPEHPPTDPGLLSPRRRALAWLTLSLFVLLFMPAWLRRVIPAGTAG